MEPHCCHSTKSTQGLTGSKRTILSALSNFQVGRSSSKVQKRKRRKGIEEKIGMRLGSILSIYWQECMQRLLHGVASMFELCFSQRSMFPSRLANYI
jgi:hypothetical protein